MLSLQDRARVAAKMRQNKEEEAKYIINFWESDKSNEYPEIYTGNKKIKEETEQLKKENE